MRLLKRQRRACSQIAGIALVILIAGWLLVEVLRRLVSTALAYWWVIALMLAAAWLAPKAPAIFRSLGAAKEKMKNDWLPAEKRKHEDR